MSRKALDDLVDDEVGSARDEWTSRAARKGSHDPGIEALAGRASIVSPIEPGF